MSREYLIVAAVVLLGFLALFFLKLGGHKTEQKMEMSAGVVTIVAKDYAFDAPASIPAGITTFKFTNKGKELHHATILKIAQGHKLAEFMDALKKPMEGPAPDWVIESGGPNAVIGADIATTTVNLDPGQYVLMCFIPGADGVPHFAKGMIKPFVVVPSSETPATEPTADLAMKLDDYGFEFAPEIAAGKHVIKVQNDGPQHHEVEFVKLLPGTTFQAFVDWAKSEQGPPPSVKWLGGLAGTAKDNYGYVTVDFEPGDYALICFLPDTGDGKPHVAHGMVQPLTVK